MFRGNFSIFRDFYEKRYLIPAILRQKHTKFQNCEPREKLKIRPQVRDFCMKYLTPCLGISCKNTTQNCGTYPYVLTCEYAPPPPGTAPEGSIVCLFLVWTQRRAELLSSFNRYIFQFVIIFPQFHISIFFSDKTARWWSAIIFCFSVFSLVTKQSKTSSKISVLGACVFRFCFSYLFVCLQTSAVFAKNLLKNYFTKNKKTHIQANSHLDKKVILTTRYINILTCDNFILFFVFS